jgi:hypothetical protein
MFNNRNYFVGGDYRLPLFILPKLYLYSFYKKIITAHIYFFKTAYLVIEKIIKTKGVLLMNIHVTVKIDSPELLSAILALSEALPQVKLNVKSKLGIQEASVPTVEEIRAKLAELQRAGKNEEVKALIKRFGGSRLSEVKEEDYEALLREANSIK